MIRIAYPVSTDPETGREVWGTLLVHEDVSYFSSARMSPYLMRHEEPIESMYADIAQLSMEQGDWTERWEFC